ncbi:hypothetical protein ACOACO_17325 [Nocardioides sp. CPCC 205120]|uniref:hypothetical protein n=1 Tax=Nocardioides sp. CPCC 205120 TaxID=3406462 RepID=UPI003B5061E1
MTDAARLELVAEVVAALQLDHEYSVAVPVGDSVRVEAIRAAGRVAGRRLGWNVRTLVFGLDADSTVQVHVVVARSTRERDARAAERRQAAMRKALDRLLVDVGHDEGPPPPPCEGDDGGRPADAGVSG